MSLHGVFDYAIPETMRSRVQVGMPVHVSLQNRTLWGIVLEIRASSSVSRLKPLLQLDEESWNESSCSLITLYSWISTYYHTPVGDVFKPLLKGGVQSVAPKTRQVYSLSSSPPEQMTPRQKEMYERVRKYRGTVSRQELRTIHGLSEYMIRSFITMGVLRAHTEQVYRNPSVKSGASFEPEGVLSTQQQQIYEGIISGDGRPALIHGVTGSGKTLLYQELARYVLQKGMGVLILVPEISLTPQTVSRFVSVLGDTVAVFHSRMSAGERRDSMDQILQKKKRVLIGARSSILAPLPSPGLIIVDEEHDGSYKQDAPAPRYHARDVAVMRGHLQGAQVVLGSATPSIESYENAQSGKYSLYTLSERFGEAALPQIDVVDMKPLITQGEAAPLSPLLRREMEYALWNNRQIILLFNRRGFSRSRICSSCGEVHMCPHCSVNMVYHRNGDQLRCHHCGFVETPEGNCPTCGAQEMVLAGTGIQKVEEYLSQYFPHARVLRMDHDTTRKKDGHSQIIYQFESRKADILLGTQMVAKGLNFPGVSLVGVLQADTALSVPDFRGSERLFQLLMQVAGRAGRTDNLGKVVLQTFSPQAPAITYAAAHDYAGFFFQERADRSHMRYPPFSYLARLLFVSKQEDSLMTVSEAMARMIQKEVSHKTAVLGPVAASIARIKKEFRATILLKSSDRQELHRVLTRVEQARVSTVKNVRIAIDVDPNSME
ncbi:primosome assembly protein PriA [Chitinivibrio alkaliphilus ACht1]|uniref:Replication restart protein PriA n=2 Tax=Chitinivibrio TaxID=1505231 RepID=U7D7C2_9BACT|nr:primosome assembly protein PriA [Chitinivibrio alkaliphilus ACht1]